MEHTNLSNYDKNDIFWKDFVNLPENPYKLDTPLKNFNCLFVFPTKTGDFSQNYYPLPLGNMASLVRMNGGKAEILVQDLKKYPKNKFKDRNLICFYPMTTSFSEIINTSEKLKRQEKNTKICFFNSDQHQHEMLLCAPKARDFGKIMMKRFSSLDFLLVGESENSFIHLCEKLANKNSNFSDLPACFYRNGEEIKLSSKPIEPVNFKFLPFASRDNLEDTISKEGINILSPRIQSKRGCASPCFYCAESSSNITIGGRKKSVLMRDTTKFVDEIELLQKNYGVVFFNVTDSSFEDPGKRGIKRMKEFYEEISNRDIRASFKIHLRAETVSKLKEEFLDKLKYVGVDIIGIGLESGVDRELSSYKKIATIQDSIKSIHKLEDQGKFYAVVGHMMFGPILKLDDLSEKINFLETIHRGWDYLDISDNILIFPGTAYHEFIKSKGLDMKCDDLSPTIPYRFEDERVRSVSNEMGKLKSKCPETIRLNNRLYDAMNMTSRYLNKMNKHLWVNKQAFKIFRSKINEVSYEVEKTYTSYFRSLIDLAGEKYSERKANLLFQEHIPQFFPYTLNKTNNLITNFIQSCESKGLSTDKLYLKTWLSLINTQVNTAGGKNE